MLHRNANYEVQEQPLILSSEKLISKWGRYREWEKKNQTKTKPWDLMLQGDCAHRKLSQLLCSTHHPKGCIARSAPRAGSGAKQQQSCSQPEQHHIPYYPLSPKHHQALSALQSTPAPAGREPGGCGTPGDSGGLQHPAGTASPGGTQCRGWRGGHRSQSTGEGGMSTNTAACGTRDSSDRAGHRR